MKSLIHWHDEVAIHVAPFSFQNSLIPIPTGQSRPKIWTSCSRSKDFCWWRVEKYDWPNTWQVKIFVENQCSIWQLLQRRQEQGRLHRLPGVHCSTAGCVSGSWEIEPSRFENTSLQWRGFHIPEWFLLSLDIVQGDFFHWYPPKNSKCQPVSKFWHLELFWSNF